MTNEIDNKEEVLHESDPRLKGVHPLFVGILISAILIIGLSIGLIINSSNNKANAQTLPTTTVESSTDITEPSTTIEETVPATEEIIPTEPASEPSEAPAVEENVAPNGMTDAELLACVIYQEAGSDKICDDCRRRVADVVLNRVASTAFPNQDTIYDVLMRQGQYGRFHWTGVKWPAHASYASELHAVERARRIAQEVLDGNHSELYEEGYVWQAEFKQGKDIIYCCGIYFGRLR